MVSIYIHISFQDTNKMKGDIEQEKRPKMAIKPLLLEYKLQLAAWLPPGLPLPASYLNWLQLKSQLTSPKIKACRKRP